jgi:hypothetical protein
MVLSFEDAALPRLKQALPFKGRCSGKEKVITTLNIDILFRYMHFAYNPVAVSELDVRRR